MSVPFGFTAQLPQRFDDVQKTAGQSRLSDGELTAARIDGKIPLVSQIVSLDEFASLAFLAIAEVFNLNHHGDRIVIVDFKKIDILALNFAEDPLANDLHTECRFVRQHVGDLKMRPFSVGDKINELVRDLLGLFFRG